MNKWAKYNEKRKNFKLSEEQRAEIDKYISNYIFDEKDLKTINDALENSDVCEYRGRYRNKFVSKEDLVKKIYIMRFKMRIPTLYMASYLNMNYKTTEHKIKQMGWEYSLKQSQQIASRVSRDYKAIHSKARQTMIKNTIKKGNLSGSTIESCIRTLVNETLTEMFDNNYSIVVGVNTLGVLQDGREVDIPIVIINNKINEVHKYVIEANGDYWHEKRTENDAIKKEDLRKLGWRYLEIEIHRNDTIEKIQEIIKNTCKQIKTKVNRKIKTA